MRLHVNGEPLDTDTDSLATLIASHAPTVNGRGYAVAVNGEVVPRADWQRRLRDGDRVEILAATQGG